MSAGVPLLSVCMIVRDEARALPATLACLAPPVDEIVVVDTGSRDATAEIARDAGARVLGFAWCDDFAAARNAALAAARGRFGLALDADERVTPESWSRLEAFLAKDCHARGRITIASETRDGVLRERIPRLWRNDGRARFVGRIHEQLVAPGPIGDSGVECRHDGYRDEVIAARGKIARNLALLRRAVEDDPQDAYLRFQLGRTLWREGRQSEEALAQLGAAVEEGGGVPPGSPEPWAAEALRDLAQALREAGRFDEALAWVERGRALHPGFTDLAFLAGLLHLDRGDAAAMRRAFESCLELGETERHPSVEGVGSYRAHHNLGLYRELSGDPARARQHYRAALRARPDFRPSLERLTALGVEP